MVNPYILQYLETQLTVRGQDQKARGVVQVEYANLRLGDDASRLTHQVSDRTRHRQAGIQFALQEHAVLLVVKKNR